MNAMSLRSNRARRAALPTFSLLGLLAICLGLVTACGPADDSNGISEVTVPKGSESIRPERPVSAFPWSVPPGWIEVERDQSARIATFVIERLEDPMEVAVTRFPGDVGGLLANVNRWRAQIGLPPIGPDELSEVSETFSNPGFEGHTMHFQGEQSHMLVGSIFEPAANRTWFVRVVVPPEIAAMIRAEVFQFIRSFGAPNAD